MDPVTLGLCSQIDLDLEVKRASKGSVGPDEAEEGTMLLTAEEALARAGGRGHAEGAEDEFSGTDHRPEPADSEFDADSVFSKLKSLQSDPEN
jgi:hypothetical protein